MIDNLKKEFSRAISWRLLVILIIPICMPMDTIVDWQWLFKSDRLSVFYFYYHAVQFGGLFGRHFVSIFCSIPFCLSFIDEYKSGMSCYIYQKSANHKEYLWSKYMVSIITGGIVLSLGTTIFLWILARFLPLVHENDLMESLAYYKLLVTGNGELYFVCAVYFSFLSGCLYAGVASLVSSILPNKYITAASPLVFSFFLSQCGISEKSMLFFYFSRLLSMRIRIETVPMTIFYVTIIVIAIIIGFGNIFVKKTRERIVYDI